MQTSQPRLRNKRTNTPPRQPIVSHNSMQETLQAILTRLNTLEKNYSTNNHSDNTCQHNLELPTISDVTFNCSTPSRNVTVTKVQQNNVSNIPIRVTTPPGDRQLDTSRSDIIINNVDQAFREDRVVDSTQALADAIKSISSQRSQPYFVSSFDPSLHNIEVWCAEVERAKDTNGWSDSECLSRVSKCLRGDARTWLDEWVTNERTWSNFLQEFKPLCPRTLDYANILFDIMKTTSEKICTYAEYARRSLLRLRVVKGLSEELMTLIIIRGISDPQIRAAAANANLTCDNIVSFLNIYVKPSNSTATRNNLGKRPLPLNHMKGPLRCFNCGQSGHKRLNCTKKPKDTIVSTHAIVDSSESTQRSVTSEYKSTKCDFCKKPGHREENCFAKERSNMRNKRNLNLCTTLLLTDPSRSKDVVTAVIQGIPVDAPIDSGALNISFISSGVVKYLSCELKPINCALKGISATVIHANFYVTLTIEFDEITLKADFVVVPESCIAFPLIIGTDILNRDGVTYVRSKAKQYLTRSPMTQQQVNTVVPNTKDQINTPLQGDDRNLLMLVINDFSNYLISGTTSTTVTTGKMSIVVKDDTPIAYRPYRLPHQEKLKVREIVHDLKEKGIIHDSNSEYVSPILLVKKKDGSDRMCVDFRALNRVTVRDRYPMPLIDDHIDRLGNFKYFSSLDMATGFHQIQIDEESIHRTAFVIPEGHFEYLKMPYGLTNSPIVYQRIINETLRKHIEAGNVLVYVDDVLLMSHAVEEGINLLRDVLTTLTNAGFSINLRKCTFLSMQVEYLGRMVSQGQVRPSPSKVEALVNAPAPANVKQGSTPANNFMEKARHPF
ncbi:uncharacterized protein LOC128201458 [Galleria mellonella]|uniref:Uncharacterized protein LOC128201458 n=1 Tax=Galleria mellonella TaxID=7137 RepID=A0ABM3MTA4_GALME|nr:uncharacterized protein LOC128201458 [Galleria mellonella]